MGRFILYKDKQIVSFLFWFTPASQSNIIAYTIIVVSWRTIHNIGPNVRLAINALSGRFCQKGRPNNITPLMSQVASLGGHTSIAWGTKWLGLSFPLSWSNRNKWNNIYGRDWIECALWLRIEHIVTIVLAGEGMLGNELILLFSVKIPDNIEAQCLSTASLFHLFHFFFFYTYFFET